MSNAIKDERSYSETEKFLALTDCRSFVIELIMMCIFPIASRTDDI